MKHTRVARRYATALMEAVGTGPEADDIGRDLQLVGATLAGSRELRLLVASPVIPAGKKAAVFKELFAARVRPHTMAFIDLLIAKQRERALEEAITQFLALRDAQLGIVTIGVSSAIALTRQQEDALRAELERRTGKKVRLQMSLDPGIRGGLVVRVGDTVLDASVRHQLEVLGERFARGEYAPA